MNRNEERIAIASAAGIYRALLALLPAEATVEDGNEMVETFREICREAHGRGGRLAVARVTALAGFDLARRLLPEWREARTLRRSIRRSRPRTKGGIRMLDALSRDVRDAGRSLVRSPGYTTVVALTLALALGANAAVFSVIDAVTLKPLPYPDADRIVTLAELTPGIDIRPQFASVPNFVDWRSQSKSFDSIALFRGRTRTLTGRDEPLSIYTMAVTASFFEVFDVPPLVGRVFSADENVPGRAGSVVLSYALWQQLYGAERAAMGRTLQIDGTPYTITGVMPPAFEAPASWLGVGVDIALWLPFPLDPSRENRSSRSSHVAGRLAPGISLAAARAELDLIRDRLAAAHPEANEHWTTFVLPWRDVIVGEVGSALRLLWGLVFVVLLVASANVAGLTLQRVLARQGDLAVRTALGAGRKRIVRHVLIECLMVATAGSALGLVGAQWLIGFIRRLEAGTIPLAGTIALDVRVVSATLITTVAVALAAGLWPALLATRADPADVLRTATSRWQAPRQRGRAGIVAGQLALAHALVTIAVLLVASFARLAAVPAGFDPDRVFTATIALSWDRVDTIERRTTFVRNVLERLQVIPGVTSVAMINSLPLTDSNQYQPIRVEGRPPAPPGKSEAAAIRGISPGYFRTLSIELLRGRDFDERDVASGAPAIVNRSLATRFWRDDDPLGQRIVVGDGPPASIVGVVEDVRHYGLDKPSRPEIYLPYSRDSLTSKTFVLRTSIDPVALEKTVRRAILEVDPEQPIRDVATMESLVDRSLAGRRFGAVTVSLAAAIAAFLAFVGLFGTVGYAVTTRGREFGIRLALGARPAQIRHLVLGWAAALAATGVLLGLAIAWLTAGPVRGFLFGFDPYDPRVHAGIGVVFAGLTLAASYGPAWRASRIEATRVLRES